MITPYDVQYAIRNQQNNPRNITTDFLPTEYGIKAKAKEFLKQGQKLTVDRDEDFDWIPEYMQ
ncbi:MAG: hypothetical protein WCG98_08225 [bacterium]